MIISFIITFRETLEAVLLVSIVLGILKKADKPSMRKYVTLGSFLGFVSSFLFALLFELVFNGFEGVNEHLFEGITTVIGSIFVFSIILWVHRQSHPSDGINQKLGDQNSKKYGFQIFSVVFFGILREGVETVIFFNTLNVSTGISELFGAVLGILIAIGVGILLYIGVIRMNISRFFKFTNILLTFVATGLLVYGIHELQEAGVVPIIIEHIYDINYLLDEKSGLGQFIKALFGYNGNPSLIETTIYLVVLSTSLTLLLLKKNKKPTDSQKSISSSQE